MPNTQKTAKIQQTVNYTSPQPNLLISGTLLTTISDLVLSPASAGQNVTVITFKKSGFPFNLRHTFSTLPNQNKALMLWFPLESHLSSSEMISTVLLTLKRTHSDLLQSHALEILSTMLAKEKITQGELLAFCDFLALDEKIKLLFVFDDFESLYGAQPASEELVTLIENLTMHCTKYAGFIFIATSSIPPANYPQGKSFWGMFQSNVIGGAEFLYDSQSIELSAKNFQQKNAIKFTPAFIEKVAEFSYGDPAVVLYSFYQTLADDGFTDKVKKANSDTAYQIFGSDYLDWRFTLLTSKMTGAQINSLKSEKPQEPYLFTTGLVSKKNNQIVYLNPLFEYFVKNRLKNLKPQKSANQQKTDFELKGQELLLYNLLSATPGEIVSKDKIAAAIWGDTWEQKYSDWALDKLISTLKKKLVDYAQPVTLQTFKKLGVMLVPIERP